VFNEPAYRKHLVGRANHQYVMIGYSASNKESGIVMSRWLLRNAQEALFAAADRAGIDLTLFHGQGDGGSRGGGRTEVLVRSGPDSARRGRLRITEQGELINEKYGLRPIALRVFEQAFNALTLSRAGVIAPEHVDPKWRAAMDLLGDEAARVYRATVYRGFRRVLSPGRADRRDRAHADRLAADVALGAHGHRGAALDSVDARVVAVPLHVARLVRRRQRVGAGGRASRRTFAANPYIDPMHLVQVDLLRRWRAGGRNDKELLSALVATVSGIAQALQGA
jgi:phosphoenolpyruvate carboxylase